MKSSVQWHSTITLKFKIHIIHTYFNPYSQYTKAVTMNQIKSFLTVNETFIILKQMKYVGQVTCCSRGINQRCGQGNTSDMKYFTTVVVVWIMYPIGCGPTYLSCPVLYNSNLRIAVPTIAPASVFFLCKNYPIIYQQIISLQQLLYKWNLVPRKNTRIFWSDMNWDDNEITIHIV